MTEPTLEQIQQIVCAEYGIPLLEIKSDRHGAAVEPRHIAMYLCRVHTHHSLPRIGRAFGHRHHTTVMHALSRVRADKRLQEIAESFSKLLQTIGQ